MRLAALVEVRYVPERTLGKQNDADAQAAASLNRLPPDVDKLTALVRANLGIRYSTQHSILYSMVMLCFSGLDKDGEFTKASFGGPTLEGGLDILSYMVEQGWRGLATKC